MIGILGSGLMGKSIAIEFAKINREVIIYSAERHLRDDDLKNELIKIIKRSKIEEYEKILDKITIGHIPADFSKCDIIIETLKENLEIKRKIIKAFSSKIENHTIFCTNTSSLSVKEIFSEIIDLKYVMGLHFFNPVSIMKLVEVTFLENNSNEIRETILNLINEIGKSPVVVKDSSGFVVNKLLIPYINEAAKLLEQGIAKPEDIDSAMMLGANHPIGPLKLADLIGLDIIYNILLSFNDKGLNIQISKLIIEMVEENKLGRKTKIGFYDYSLKK